MNSKNKGSRGERELAEELRKYGFDDAKRMQQFCGGADSPDVSGIDGIHIECKRVEKLNIYDAMEQSERDSEGKTLPAVFHRRNRKKWLVTMYLQDWIEVYNGKFKK